MSKTVLTLRKPPHLPLEVEVLAPNLVAAMGNSELRSLPIFLGKRQLRLDDYFDIDGDGSDDIEIRGDCGRVKWLGKGMTSGRLKVVGNAGMHLGSHMKGGTIEVTGNAADWAGGEMKGGTIKIAGNAGGQIGSAYRGGMTGMSGGAILIGGSAGTEIGMRMRRGIIAVGGPVRDFAGLQMKGGTIVLMAGGEIRTGAWMARGTIISLKPIKLLPTFAYCCDYNPTFMQPYAKHLAACGFALPEQGAYRRYMGDTAVPGKGEILVWQPR
jgi:formylmethanofuran dehydrogenase subunit C